VDALLDRLATEREQAGTSGESSVRAPGAHRAEPTQ
jgi:hypothetical protein